MAYLRASIPTIRCLVDHGVAYNLESHNGEYIPCTVTAVTCEAGYALLFNIILENGAGLDRVPIHKLAWKPPGDDTTPTGFSLESLQLWDCFSKDFTVMTDQWRKHMEVQCRLKGVDGWQHGEYLFTIDWAPEENDYGVSRVPEEHKCHHVIKLDCGRFAALPNNRIIWLDPSFVTEPLTENPGYITNHHAWSVETRWRTGSSNSFYYEVAGEEPFHIMTSSDDGAAAERKTVVVTEPPARAACSSIHPDKGLQCERGKGHPDLHQRAHAGEDYFWR